MAKFWLIRHGETDWNAQRRYQGGADRPLNETGIQQARALVPHLAEVPFSNIYSSPMMRVRQTAKLALTDNRLKGVHYDDRLREMTFGKFEGLTREEIQAKYPAEFDAWWADRTTNPHGGDLFEDVLARVASFWSEMRVQHARDDHVLIFAHGGILGMLLCVAMETDPLRWWRFRILNCTLNELHSYDGGSILVQLNARPD